MAWGDIRMKFIRFIAFALVFCTFMLYGCSKRDADAYSVLAALVIASGEDFEQNGYVYSSRASEGDAEYLPRDTLATLYGEKYIEYWDETVEECALFLCTRGVGEIAVFKCYSRSDTETVSTMLLERADELKVALRHTEWEEESGEISIEVKGKYLLFAFTRRSEQLSKDFRSLV